MLRVKIKNLLKIILKKRIQNINNVKKIKIKKKNNLFVYFKKEVGEQETDRTS